MAITKPWDDVATREIPPIRGAHTAQAVADTLIPQYDMPDFRWKMMMYIDDLIWISSDDDALLGDDETSPGELAAMEKADQLGTTCVNRLDNFLNFGNHQKWIWNSKIIWNIDPHTITCNSDESKMQVGIRFQIILPEPCNYCWVSISLSGQNMEHVDMKISPNWDLGSVKKWDIVNGPDYTEILSMRKMLKDNFPPGCIFEDDNYKEGDENI